MANSLRHPQLTRFRGLTGLQPVAYVFSFLIALRVSSHSMTRAKNLVLLPFLLAVTALSVSAAEEGGVAASASPLIDLGNGWTISNSMITGWVISALLVLLIL